MSFKHIMSRVISPTYIKTSSIAKMAPLIDGWIVARRIKGWEFETVEVSVPRAAKLRLAKLAYDHKKYLGKHRCCRDDTKKRLKPV